MRKTTELTKAQLKLLLSLPDFGNKHVVDYYPPAIKLVEMGLAYWYSENKLSLTFDGLETKAHLKS